MIFMMSIIFPLAVVLILLLVVLGGISYTHLENVFGVFIPYLAIAIFLIGFIYRILSWAKSPVPFRITTVCGQEKSLDWIKANRLESPFTTLDVIKRMALEVLLFRSLFRNTSTELKEGPKVIHWSAKWLWLAGLAFHWALLIILLRHLRFFIEPVPFAVDLIDRLDTLFAIGVPALCLTDVVIVAAITHLFLRRVLVPKIRYISLPADYFPLFLLLSIIGSGMLMRHIYKVDLIKVKELALSLVSFRPVIPEGIGVIFYVHLFFVCLLIAYFPFSKLMHLGGVFLSPTRNLANNNRAKRHTNPWNYPVKVHTYAEYEDEFREKMKTAAIPVDKE
jgi:nitrate reductase gamma subunit